MRPSLKKLPDWLNEYIDAFETPAGQSYLNFRDGYLRLLHRRVVAHQHMMENVCSYEWADTDAYRAKIERAESRLRDQLMDHPNVESVHFSGDPRGCTVKVIMRDGKANTWDNAPDGRRYFGL